MTLVGIMDIGKKLGHLGEIAFRKTVTGLVFMIVEVGDGVPDGDPTEGAVGEGGKDKQNG